MRIRNPSCVSMAVPLRDRTSTGVARAIFENLICYHGLPKVIFTDRGKEFQAVVKALCVRLGICKYETTGYQPQANGRMIPERNTFRACQRTTSRMGRISPHCPVCVQNPTNRSTGHSPYELMYGREPWLPADAVMGEMNPQAKGTPQGYVEETAQRLRVWYERARKQQDRVRAEHDASGKAIAPNHKRIYRKNDMVLYWSPQKAEGIPSKLQDRWTGPYRVVRTEGQKHIVITLGSREERTNANRIKLYEPYGEEEKEDESPEGQASNNDKGNIHGYSRHYMSSRDIPSSVSRA